MKYSFDFYMSILVVNRKLTKEYFLSRIGAKAGYSKTMFTIMYDAVFSEAQNLQELFEVYYKVEYKSFEEFLYKKFCMPAEFLDEMMNMLRENSDYVIILFSDIYYGHSGIVEFAFSDTMYDRVTDIILMK